jgi:hypothetical protein
MERINRLLRKYGSSNPRILVDDDSVFAEDILLGKVHS